MTKRYRIKELKKLVKKDLVDHVIYLYNELDEKEVEKWKEEKPPKNVKTTTAE